MGQEEEGGRAGRSECEVSVWASACAAHGYLIAEVNN